MQELNPWSIRIMNSSSAEAEMESSNYNIHPFITTSFIHQQQRQHNASLLATDHAFVSLNIGHLAFMLIRPVCIFELNIRSSLLLFFTSLAGQYFWVETTQVKSMANERWTTICNTAGWRQVRLHSHFALSVESWGKCHSICRSVITSGQCLIFKCLNVKSVFHGACIRIIQYYT